MHRLPLSHFVGRNVSLISSPRSAPLHTTGRVGGAYWNEQTGAPTKLLLDVARFQLREGNFGDCPLRDQSRLRQLKSDAAILEFGPGIGDAIPTLLEAAPQGKVVVVDKDPAVVSFVAQEFSGVCAIEASRPKSEAVPERSIDYVRATRVLPYLNEEEALAFFDDAAQLLKPNGALFFTAYHPSMREIEGFRRHSLEHIAKIALSRNLQIDVVDIDIRAPGGASLEFIHHQVLDAHAPSDIRRLDNEIENVRARHGEDVEVELRIYIRRPKPNGFDLQEF